jgi:hypothetical protein
MREFSTGKFSMEGEVSPGASMQVTLSKRLIIMEMGRDKLGENITTFTIWLL